MKTRRACFSCHSCGRGVESSPGQPPCHVLKGWLGVSHWKGVGSVEHYYFCSFSCLKSWLTAQVPEVPQVFLESFEEGKS